MLDLGKLFDLLILARNSQDEEALQEAIDAVAIELGHSEGCEDQPNDVNDDVALGRISRPDVVGGV